MPAGPLLDVGSSLAGYLGAGLIVVAYLLNQRGRLASAGWRYPAINLAGSGLVMLSLFVHPNLPSAVIEAFWITISVYGLVRALLHPPA